MRRLTKVKDELTELDVQKPFTRAVSELVDVLNSGEAAIDATERVGEIKLADGRLAQVHVTVTTEVDDFLELT